MKQKLRVGDMIPVFKSQDQNGEWVDLKDFIGLKKLVIYFYPKDDTPGCTKEACSFSDQFEDFKAVNAEVFGISADDVSSHKKFAEKYRLSFRLLSDVNNEVRKLFGVPSDLFGLLPGRVTYVVNLEGKLIYQFNSQFNAKKHVSEALQKLQQDAL